MNLETVLTISLLFYLGFMILLGIEYFTDKRKGHREEPQPKRTKKLHVKKKTEKKDTKKPKKAEPKQEATETTELEAPAELQEKPGELAVEYPAEWDEEEYE